nr:hypothetical protein [Candidatus Sigynarchaeota archaeon]
MDLPELKNEIKKTVLGMGASLVGFGSRNRLAQAPPSGNMDYCLPGAQSCIIWAYAAPIEALKAYFTKVERTSIKQYQYFAYTTAWKTAQEIARLIEANTTYKAFPVVPNARYRGNKPGKSVSYNTLFSIDIAYPDFSLRYGAVAAGLGQLGWSGNVVTKEHGGAVFLGGVLTTAPFDADPMAEKNQCNKCKLCVQACTTGFFSMDETGPPVIIGGIPQVPSKRHTIMRCGFGCAGFTGLSKDKKWSTWSPGAVCVADIPEAEMRKRVTKIKIFWNLLFSPKTRRAHRHFYLRIKNSFMCTGKSGNVALRPLEETNPRCGFCSLICVADPKQRKDLFASLVQSGRVYLDDQGNEIVKKVDVTGKETVTIPSTS